MTPQQALEHNRRYIETADQLIDELQLNPKLSELGEVEFLGSYALGLMYKPDIDISVYLPNPSRAQAISLMSDLANSDLRVCRANIYDPQIEPRPGVPVGYYAGLDVKVENVRWQIDIWLQDKAKQLESNHRLSQTDFVRLKNLEEDQRAAVIQIKAALDSDNRYQSKLGDCINTFNSFQVYRGILDGGITNVDELIEWYKRKPFEHS